MNVDELKTAWQSLDRKLLATKTLNEKLITSIVTERSGNRFQTVRRNYLIGFAWLILCLGAGLAVFFGNPFGYEYTLQYIPMIIYCVGLLIITGWMMQSYLHLGRIKLDQANIRTALKDIVAVYERPKKLMGYVLWVFLFSQTILFPLSFLPKSINRLGFWPALGERMIPISIAILMLFVAHKLGAFKERQGAKFKEDLNELEQLKKMAAELE
jgi:flagellar biosynthesis protein FliQ